MVQDEILDNEGNVVGIKKTFEVWDATSNPPDWVTFNHGDAITSDPQGRLKVIPQLEIANYIKLNNIHNAQVTVNGMVNQGLDAIQMYQASTTIRNQESPRESVVPTFHIFKDQNMAFDTGDVLPNSKSEVPG